MKFRVENPEKYEKTLKQLLGTTLGASSVERDEFYRCDALGFPGQGKTLRIRRRGSYLAATFKGPRLDDETKSREEIELPLTVQGSGGSGGSAIRDALVDRARADWSRFFQRLGFTPAAVVEKTRRRGLADFDGRHFEITLDSLEGLGDFTEIETIAPESDFETAREVVITLADRLGLHDSIAKSYLALKMEAESGEVVDEK